MTTFAGRLDPASFISNQMLHGRLALAGLVPFWLNRGRRSVVH